VQCILEAVVTFFGTENSEPVMLIVVVMVKQSFSIYYVFVW
jgi:hypothetical protein